jgi:MEMO1 family protein
MKFIILSFLIFYSCDTANASYVREPAFAGSFYPADSKVLKSEIQKLMKKARLKLKSEDTIYGFIVPHAGYEFSGKTAAYAYKILQTIPVDTIILLGPYHKSNFPGVSIWAQGAWKSPLGTTQIDQEIAEELQHQSEDFQVEPSLHLREHSLEVQLPFIQTAAPQAKIVPILISDPAYAHMLARAIHKVIKGKKILVLASTDLSHYHPDAKARFFDKTTIKTILTVDPLIFKKAYLEDNIQLCGGAAVLTLLELGKLWHTADIDILNTSNSGEATHDLTSVVGYASAVVQERADIPSALQHELLLLTRKTLLEFLQGRHKMQHTENVSLSQVRAVFVTLRDRKGTLRGCIGRLQAEEPLYEAVQHMVIEAASKDSRFSPVRMKEFDDLIIEISILSEPKTVRSSEEIHIGEHGVIVSKGANRGVFLPEVAKDFKSKNDFLSELCEQKAGLPRTCWTDPSVKLEVFNTQNFGEEHKVKSKRQ